MSASARLSSELKAKLSPLLRLLSSDNEGERANAFAAIGRQLKNHGLDWHDLTEVLLAEPHPAPEPPAPEATTWRRLHQLAAVAIVSADGAPF